MALEYTKKAGSVGVFPTAVLSLCNPWARKFFFFFFSFRSCHIFDFLFLLLSLQQRVRQAKETETSKSPLKKKKKKKKSINLKIFFSLFSRSNLIYNSFFFSFSFSFLFFAKKNRNLFPSFAKFFLLRIQSKRKKKKKSNYTPDLLSGGNLGSFVD